MTQRLIQIQLAASVMWVLGAAAADPPKVFPSPFKINIHVTAKGDELFENWDRPTGKDFSVDSIKIAPRGTFLSAVILFRACKPDSSGTCNAVVDIVAYDPNGKTYGEMRRVELWQQKPAPAPGYTQLSRTFMGIVIEPNDPPGTYRVTAVARDLNEMTESRSETQFEVK
jgi:hypothetical protein